MNNKLITVTQPYLPPLEEFIPYLEIWENKWLTNNGPFHQQLERALCEYLGVERLALFTNGTIALVTALQTLRITGEVITTPYSFVATSHDLWNNIRPVFVDIDPVTMNLDPDKIEAAISPQTTAIMPVHCYGNPCNVERIQQIADIYGLKVIYDAAHAFGVRYKGESLLKHGDLTVLSFHATKVFNTIEGGAIVCPDAKTKQRIDYLKNFGIADEVTVMAAGINGKMNEVQAAFGMLQLKHMATATDRRKACHSALQRITSRCGRDYCLVRASEQRTKLWILPDLIGPEYSLRRDEVYQRLREADIHARRYFYPLISDMPMYRGLPSAAPLNLPNAKIVAEGNILCLPIYNGILPKMIKIE